MSDIDVIEINEAFASMAVYCRDTLNIDWERLNPRGKLPMRRHSSEQMLIRTSGGAIALGHPFGMTGVRQIVCGLSECRRRKGKLLLTSMCMGTGSKYTQQHNPAQLNKITDSFGLLYQWEWQVLSSMSKRNLTHSLQRLVKNGAATKISSHPFSMRLCYQPLVRR